MRVQNQANLSPQTIAEIEVQLPDQENLQDLMKWALSHPAGTFLPQVVADVVVQDEFTLDVIVPWRDGLVLVYDTTCVGGIAAVAVWNHPPTPQELLDARLKAGWEPRPSILKDGDKVVGHAACAVINPST